MRALARRVRRIEQQTVAEQWGIVPIVAPDQWPDEVRIAYQIAETAGDWDAHAAIIAAQTGEQASSWRRDGTPWLIEIEHAGPRVEEVCP